MRLGITSPDTAGSLGRVATIIGKSAGNILELRHERAFGSAYAKETTIEIDIELRDAGDRDPLIAALEAAGFKVRIESQ